MLLECEKKMPLEKDTFGVYADSEGPDQPAHARSLIRVFAIRLQSHEIL